MSATVIPFPSIPADTLREFGVFNSPEEIERVRRVRLPFAGVDPKTDTKLFHLRTGAPHRRTVERLDDLVQLVRMMAPWVQIVIAPQAWVPDPEQPGSWLMVRAAYDSSDELGRILISAFHSPAEILPDLYKSIWRAIEAQCGPEWLASVGRDLENFEMPFLADLVPDATEARALAFSGYAVAHATGMPHPVVTGEDGDETGGDAAEAAFYGVMTGTVGREIWQMIELPQPSA